MENTEYGKRREGRWTPIRAKVQDTRANPNSWETHLVRKRWDIGLLRALSLRIMMMMMMMKTAVMPSTAVLLQKWCSERNVHKPTLQMRVLKFIRGQLGVCGGLA